MTYYDLYGIGADSLDEAKAIIEKLLSLSLVQRDSSYHRGPYFSVGRMGEENFELKLNNDPFDEVPLESAFPDERYLLYINNTKRSNELRRALLASAGVIKLLRHEQLGG